MGLLYGVLGLLALFLMMRIVASREAERRRELERPVIQGSWLRDRLEAMASPSLLLEPAGSPGFSKLGGRPESLPAAAYDADLRSREFLCQIDLHEAHAASGPDWLPSSGRLYAFYDPEGHGRPDVVRIVFEAAASAEGADLGASYPERRVAFRRVISLPSLHWLGVGYHRIEDRAPSEWDRIEALATAPPQDRYQHRIGGYPNEIQDTPMALVCDHDLRGLPEPSYPETLTPELAAAADTWRLLLQIDTDDELGMQWGDAGRLYVFIRKEDARAGDFSKTVSLWQTY